MKILVAPTNIASIADSIVSSLISINEDKVVGVECTWNKVNSYGPGWVFLNRGNLRNPVLRWIKQNVIQRIALIRYILWADVIIWLWDIDKVSAFVIKILRKRIFVLWLGSDIRDPAFVKNNNKYYKELWENNSYDYFFESTERSNSIQNKFSRIRAVPLVCPEMKLYINPEIFSETELFFQPLKIQDYKYSPPSVEEVEPVIVHTPTRLNTKGTMHVRNVITLLKDAGYKFRYIEIHDKSKKEAEMAIASCDLFFDQFILGTYGMASCEAMAMGKPVFCYLMEPVVKVLPEDCPIINATIDNLFSVVEPFLQNPSIRNSVGKNSRNYVEHYHDSDKILLEWKLKTMPKPSNR